MKTNHLLISLFFMLGTTAFANELVPYENDKGKWGYKDVETENVVIKPSFDAAYAFSQGYAMVMKGKKFGCINPEGKFVLKADYDEISNFDEHGMACFKKGDKYGFLNTKFEIVIPCEFKAVGMFNQDGYVWVAKDGKFNKSGEITNAKYGIYDISGRAIVPVKYKAVGYYAPYSTINKYNDKKDAFYNVVYKYGNPYYMETLNDIPHKCFQKLPNQTTGFYASLNIDASKNIVFDNQGNMLVDATKLKLEKIYYPTDNLAPVLSKTKNGKEYWNYYNIETNNFLFEQDIEGCCWGFQDGVAIVFDNSNNAQCLINTNGLRVSDYYAIVYPRKDGVYLITKNGNKFGALDAKGNIICEVQWDKLLPSSDGLMLAYDETLSNSRYGFLNHEGKFAIKPIYNSAMPFTNGLAPVKAQKGWGYIDKNGNEYMPCVWENVLLIEDTQKRYIWGMRNNTWYLYDANRKELAFKKGFAKVKNFGEIDEDVAVVSDGNGRFGIVNIKGEMVIDMNLPEKLIISAYSKYKKDGMKTWRYIDSERLMIQNYKDINNHDIDEVITDWDY